MSKPSDVEMRMLMLGAALVRDNPAAARIVADAMAEMEKLRESKKPKTRKRKKS